MTEEQLNDFKRLLEIRLKYAREEVQYYEDKNDRALRDMKRYVEGHMHAYQTILDDSEVQLRKIELICQVGMTFLHSISERLTQKGINSYVTQNFDDETANMQIEYGDGISCKYKINLLDNFQEKILEITNRL